MLKYLFAATGLVNGEIVKESLLATKKNYPYVASNEPGSNDHLFHEEQPYARGMKVTDPYATEEHYPGYGCGFGCNTDKYKSCEEKLAKISCEQANLAEDLLTC